MTKPTKWTDRLLENADSLTNEIIQAKKLGQIFMCIAGATTILGIISWLIASPSTTSTEGRPASKTVNAKSVADLSKRAGAGSKTKKKVKRD